MRFLLAFVPLVLLVGLIAVFALNINRDPSMVQSVLINKPVPQFVLPAVEGVDRAGIDSKAIAEVTVLNVFASWCIPCRAEHPFLEQIKAATGVRMLGINQKDEAKNAVAFLTELGNPFDGVGADRDGRASIDLGVYGVPETFIVNAAGIITYKHIGPIGEHSLPEVIAAIQKAKAAL
ncbi:MAG TPA: DsbE family thiol:disulfide interchange protein [Devosia sp.]|nr:DsbE family thiol:disulfide interchange protein [Devosia sp.]